MCIRDRPYSDYPGGYRDCISVTSFSADGLPAYYTCYGPGCNIAAPGGETGGLSGGEKAGVLSTLCSEISGTDYGYMQGTSMAVSYTHLDVYKRQGLLQKGHQRQLEYNTQQILNYTKQIGPHNINVMACLLYTSRCV